MPPASVTVPLQFVLVAVMVEDVEPKADRHALEPVPVGEPVTVKPTGKVTVRVPDSVAASVKTRLKETPVCPALRRERFRVPAVVEPLMEKFSVPSVELGVASYARTVVVCVALESVPTLKLQLAGVWGGLKVQV